MKSNDMNYLTTMLQQDEAAILDEWMSNQRTSSATRGDLIDESESRQQSQSFLTALRAALQRRAQNGSTGDAMEDVHQHLQDLSRSRAYQGFSPNETATFVMSLKRPLFRRLQANLGSDGATLGNELWACSELLDRLALFTIEAHQKSREEFIARQQRELLELSTPVVELWDEILALPLVGTLDSERTQIVMETLLQRIVDRGASVAILDITGVPTVDTLVAQHLMKTVAATRLMGADCIISGIRPQIAQTIVHLGVDLSEVTTKATLADAFAAALERIGRIPRSTTGPLSAKAR